MQDSSRRLCSSKWRKEKEEKEKEGKKKKRGWVSSVDLFPFFVATSAGSFVPARKNASARPSLHPSSLQVRRPRNGRGEEEEEEEEGEKAESFSLESLRKRAGNDITSNYCWGEGRGRYKPPLSSPRHVVLSVDYSAAAGRKREHFYRSHHRHRRHVWPRHRVQFSQTTILCGLLKGRLEQRGEGKRGPSLHLPRRRRQRRPEKPSKS